MLWNGPYDSIQVLTWSLLATPQARSRSMKEITTIGLDLAKQIFQAMRDDALTARLID